MIVSKRVLRFYAPYVSSSGVIRKKGFATRMSAARFLAKQALFDLVFGEKTERFIQTAIDDGYTIWARNVPESKEERAAMFAKHFPLEECPTHHSDIWPGANNDRICDCEQYGYSRCNTREFMIQRTKDIMAYDLATS